MSLWYFALYHSINPRDDLLFRNDRLAHSFMSNEEEKVSGSSWISKHSPEKDERWRSWIFYERILRATSTRHKFKLQRREKLLKSKTELNICFWEIFITFPIYVSLLFCGIHMRINIIWSVRTSRSPLRRISPNPGLRFSFWIDFEIIQLKLFLSSQLGWVVVVVAFTTICCWN